MIEYVVATNPDERVLKRAIYCLQQGQVIVLPTDTSWILAADILSKKGVESLYEIKGIDRKKHLSLICKNISQASQYSVISDKVFKMIHKTVPGPYTFILKPSRDLPRNIRDYRKQSEIGIRIPDSVICHRLIELLDHPIISASITKEMIFDDQLSEFLNDEIYSYQIEEFVLNKVSMIIDPGEFHLPSNGSTVIAFINEDEHPDILRLGAGDILSFI